MPALGISRVTDVTRLDFLGVPVFASVRPRGRTLRVHAGKGLTAAEARVGALMEAIELAAAERASTTEPDARTTLGELIDGFDGVMRWLDFAPRLNVPVDPAQPAAALRCQDIGQDGGEHLIPAELVWVPLPEGHVSPHFNWSANGLASGNSLEEATLHALFEVLERDALAMNGARDGSVAIDPRTLPAPFADRAQAWRRRGVELFVRHVPSEFGWPCFEAFLHEPASLDVDMAVGCGMHADRDVALARAVTEAAQSRLSYIHGARDDITGFWTRYEAGQRRTWAAREEQLLARLRDGARAAITFDAVSQAPGPRVDVPSTLREVLQGLAARGFRVVLRRRFDTADGLLERAGLHVVKVIVPRCENRAGDHLRVGLRLLERVLGRG